MKPVEVKICGLTNRDDVMAALDAGADYVGFVLYPESPRGITAAELAGVLAGIDAPCRAVGVFVNESRASVERIVSDCGLYAVQIQGDEAPDEFEGMAVPVWRAVKMTDGGWKPAPGSWPVERYVIDANVPGVYGGSGERADWDAARQLAAVSGVMLAGGLTPENVADAVRSAAPMGVDVSGGVESVPGRKDHGKVADFVKAAKSVVRS